MVHVPLLGESSQDLVQQSGSAPMKISHENVGHVRKGSHKPSWGFTITMVIDHSLNGMILQSWYISHIYGTYNVLIGMKLSIWSVYYLGTKYHGHPSTNKPQKNRWMNTSFEILTRGDVEDFKVLPKKRDIHHCKSRRASVSDSPKRTPNLFCVYGARSLRFAPPFARNVRGCQEISHGKKQLMEMQEMKNAILGPQVLLGCPVGS